MRSIRAVHAETGRETFTPSTLMTALDFLGLNLKTTRRENKSGDKAWNEKPRSLCLALGTHHQFSHTRG